MQKLKGTGMGGGMPAQDNSALRCLGNWKATQKQTWFHTVSLHQYLDLAIVITFARV